MKFSSNSIEIIKFIDAKKQQTIRIQTFQHVGMVITLASFFLAVFAVLFVLHIIQVDLGNALFWNFGAFLFCYAVYSSLCMVRLSRQQKCLSALPMESCRLITFNFGEMTRFYKFMLLQHQSFFPHIIYNQQFTIRNWFHSFTRKNNEKWRSFVHLLKMSNDSLLFENNTTADDLEQESTFTMLLAPHAILFMVSNETIRETVLTEYVPEDHFNIQIQNIESEINNRNAALLHIQYNYTNWCNYNNANNDVMGKKLISLFIPECDSRNEIIQELKEELSVY